MREITGILVPADLATPCRAVTVRLATPCRAVTMRGDAASIAALIGAEWIQPVGTTILGLLALVDEEGELRRRAANARLSHRLCRADLVGDALLVGALGEEFTSVSPRHMTWIGRRLLRMHCGAIAPDGALTCSQRWGHDGDHVSIGLQWPEPGWSLS